MGHAQHQVEHLDSSPEIDRRLLHRAKPRAPDHLRVNTWTGLQRESRPAICGIRVHERRLTQGDKRASSCDRRGQGGTGDALITDST